MWNYDSDINCSSLPNQIHSIHIYQIESCGGTRKHLVPIIMQSLLINAPKFFEAKISYKPQEFDSIEELVQDQQEDNESTEDNFVGNDKVIISYIKATSTRKNEHYTIYHIRSFKS